MKEKEKHKCSICGISEDECSKFYYNTKYGNDLCNKHYIQLKRHGKIMDDVKRITSKDKTCSVCGSNKNIKHCHTNDVLEEFREIPLCEYHYNQCRKYGKVIDYNKSPSEIERKCCICGTTQDNTRIIYYTEEHKMYCLRHYSQIKNLGCIIEKTVFEPNDYIVNDNNTVTILVLNKDKIIEVIIDIDDFEKHFKNKKIGITHGYAICEKSEIQKIIMDTNELVDHINLNPLDNRKCNLRIADKSKNAINCDIRANNKSGFTGVSFNKIIGKWRAYISINGKRIELGHFENLKDAVEIRIINERKYFKEFQNKHNEENYIKKYGEEEFNKIFK